MYRIRVWEVSTLSGCSLLLRNEARVKPVISWVHKIDEGISNEEEIDHGLIPTNWGVRFS